MKQYKFKINGKPFEVEVINVDDNGLASVTVNGKEYKVEVDEGLTSGMPSVPVGNACVQPRPKFVAAKGTSVVSTPLPGVIVAVNVKVGDHVDSGTSVAVLEAMKMENAIETEVSGTVLEIHVQKGDSVLEGANIVTIG